MDPVSFNNFDAEVLALQPPPSDIKIVVELLERENVSNHNDDAIKTEDEPVYCPETNKLLQIIKTI